MPRCRAWRYAPDSEGYTSLPGTDREAWRPCRNRTRSPQPMCTDCLERAAEHPDAQVRIAVAKAPGCPVSLLSMLTTDFEPAVQAAAIAAIKGGERGEATQD